MFWRTVRQGQRHDCVGIKSNEKYSRVENVPIPIFEGRLCPLFCLIEVEDPSGGVKSQLMKEFIVPSPVLLITETPRALDQSVRRGERNNVNNTRDSHGGQHRQSFGPRHASHGVSWLGHVFLGLYRARPVWPPWFPEIFCALPRGFVYE